MFISNREECNLCHSHNLPCLAVDEMTFACKKCIRNEFKRTRRESMPKNVRARVEAQAREEATQTKLKKERWARESQSRAMLTFAGLELPYIWALNLFVIGIGIYSK